MLTARLLVDGLYAGRHASPLRGAGIEFHDYRPYTPGDDPRGVDWKLYGRTDRYYLKRYRRETDLNLHLAVDTSASMAFAGLPRRRGGPAGRSKLAVARELAAALAALALRQGDRAGLSLLDHGLRHHTPPTGSFRRLQAMTATLELAEAGYGPGDLGGALQRLGGLITRRGVVVLIADLLDDPAPLLSGIDRLRHGGSEVAVFQVLTPDELRLSAPDGSGFLLTDPESAGSVRTRPRAVAQRYARLIDAHNDAIRRALAARDTDYTLVRTDRPLHETLRRYLLVRAQRSRGAV